VSSREKRGFAGKMQEKDGVISGAERASAAIDFYTILILYTNTIY